MRAAVEFAGFSVISAALILAGFSLRPAERGSAASGAGGEHLATLEASTAAMAAMVEDWERPPEVLQQAGMQRPPEATEPPEAPEAADEHPEDASPVQPILLPDLPDLSDADLAELPPALAMPPAEVQTELSAFAAPMAMPQPDAPKPSPDAPAVAMSVPAQPPRPAPQPPDAIAAVEPPPPAPPTTPPPPGVRPKKRPDKPAPQAQVAQKAEAPSAAAADSAKQTAAGAGGGAEAGAGRQASGATLSKAQVNDRVAGWGAAIRARIERQKRYPRQAGNAAGIVTIRLNVNTAGQLAGARVTGSSGHPALDAAAMAAVQSARLPKADSAIPGGSYQFNLAVSFSR